MIERIEVLLKGWGQERISPRLEVSMPSPLGRVDDDAPAAGPGPRCLSGVECWVAMSRAVEAVDRVLNDLAESGSRGRVLYQLAVARYCQAPRLRVDEQARRLGIAERTYRCRVDELHAEVAAAWPGAVQAQAQAEASTPAARAIAQRRKDAEREGRRVRRVSARIEKAAGKRQAVDAGLTVRRDEKPNADHLHTKCAHLATTPE
ncbi:MULTISPECIES: hypothetical protein [unclassified Pseudomonas]|uniref:hypothetical protein n=1 Tax=unclassified Pseudomonas TaxID=196821 RepID=UPI00244D3971|nr:MULTISPECIES: hypothetical protein [unclassified Pseudomonas]MDG9928519.1 hypothetical protein [Pseudomonas sp. GD04042]MDH0482689.1 hypothetical protein [Pseudomonas sp. GD04015]MDH0604609.1 hypothetical protein [Pseudomonas sp. GD03869]